MGVFYLVVLLATQASTQETGNSLVQKALEKHEQYKNVIQATLDYNKTEVVEELNGHGRSKGIIPPDEDATARGKIHMSISKLLKTGRYQYSLGYVVSLNGRNVIKIDFRPGPAERFPEPENRSSEGRVAQEVENGLSDVLNSLTGSLYLDPETFGIVRLEANLPKTVFHIMAWVSKTKITYEESPVYGIWVPGKMVTETRTARLVPWPRKYKRTTISFENYRPKAP